MDKLGQRMVSTRLHPRGRSTLVGVVCAVLLVLVLVLLPLFGGAGSAY